MRAGRMSDDDWTRMARRMSEISEAPLFVDDSPNLTLMEIRAKARRLKQRNDLKLVILDYLQLMTSGRKVESRQQEVSEFSRQIKLLAKELEVPVVAISQLNRGPEQRTDKRPMLSDLRESGSIEQDADVVILLRRPDAFERDDPRRAGDRSSPSTATAPRARSVAHQLHYSRFADLARRRSARDVAGEPALPASSSSAFAADIGDGSASWSKLIWMRCPKSSVMTTPGPRG
jgi:replicative DNA helicase